MSSSRLVETSSTSLSASRSACASISPLIRSSPGSRRRAATMSRMYSRRRPKSAAVRSCAPGSKARAGPSESSSEDHCLNWRWSSAGTPSSSAITIAGSGSAKSRITSSSLASRWAREQLVHQRLDARREALLHAARREGAVHQMPDPRVIRRVHHQHAAEGVRALEQLAREAICEGLHHVGAHAVGGEARVAEHGLDVGVAREDHGAGPLVARDRRPEERAPGTQHGVERVGVREERRVSGRAREVEGRRAHRQA